MIDEPLGDDTVGDDTLEQHREKMSTENNLKKS
jgi:hypothetical protein